MSFKTLSLMRHSIAIHNEAAGTNPDPMTSVYLNERYADSSLSERGHALVKSTRAAMAGLTPAPDMVLCSPLTRTIQTAIGMFEGTGTRIVAISEVREAYGRFPCDRHKSKRNLQRLFGDSVDFSLCDDTDTTWTSDHREDMSHLNHRAARFVERVILRRWQGDGHIFVVSHGVFMEAAIRYITSNFSEHSKTRRVHNCEVHSFVFSMPTPSPTNTSILTNPSRQTLSTPTSDPSSSVGIAGAAAGGAGFDSSITIPLETAAPPLPPPPPPPSPPPRTTATVAAGDSRNRSHPILGGVVTGGGIQSHRPLLQVYLSGQELALTCAVAMPLQTAAHVNRLFRHFQYSISARGGEEAAVAAAAKGGVGVASLDETQFTAFLTECGLCAEEARSLFLRLDRQRTREVFASEFLHAVTAFYPGGVAAAAGVGYDPRAAGVMELRKRYQMEMQGTPLSNYEALERVFQRLLSAMLSIQA